MDRRAEGAFGSPLMVPPGPGRKVPLVEGRRPCRHPLVPAYRPGMHNAVSTSQRTPVVVGVDGSRSHLATVDLAVVEAVRRRAPLLIVHVWPGRYTASLRGSGPVPAEADGRHLLDIAARRALHRAPDLDISTELLDGGTAAALVRAIAAQPASGRRAPR